MEEEEIDQIRITTRTIITITTTISPCMMARTRGSKKETKGSRTWTRRSMRLRGTGSRSRKEEDEEGKVDLICKEFCILMFKINT